MKCDKCYIEAEDWAKDLYVAFWAWFFSTITLTLLVLATMVSIGINTEKLEVFIVPSIVSVFNAMIWLTITEGNKKKIKVKTMREKFPEW